MLADFLVVQEIEGSKADHFIYLFPESCITPTISNCLFLSNNNNLAHYL